MKNQNSIIWKDNRGIELFIILILSLSSVFFLSMLFLNEIKNRYFFLVPFFIAIFVLYIYSRRRLTYINPEGIIIGNLSYNKRSSYDPNQNLKLINWISIKSVLILGKIHSSRLSRTVDYLYILKKDGTKYDCLIYDPKGFIEAIKKLNKSDLISKDSKYK
jgi:hypothetical protein